MAVNIIARQVGSDVIFSGSGTINTGQLSNLDETYTAVSYIWDTLGDLRFGDGTLGALDSFQAINQTSDLLGFGTLGTQTYADTSTGDFFGVNQLIVFLPLGYTNLQPLNFTMTFTGQSISSLQLSPGTYSFNWGDGGTADSIGLTIEPPPSPTPTPTNTQTPTVTPTKTTTPTPTPTNTRTPTNTPTPSITPTITPTNTKTPTPTPSITPSVTPTITPTPTSYGVLDVNVQYDYTNEIFGSFSGGSWMEQYGNVPHPINYDPSRRLTVIDLSSITIGGQNGLNN